jgi:hypothetical protein
MRNSTVACTCPLSKILPFLKTTGFRGNHPSFFSPSSLKLVGAYPRAKDTTCPYYIIGNKFNLDAENEA